MDKYPKNPILLDNFMDINSRDKEVAVKESLWVIQRAKTYWLKYGDDDIQFLYHSIRERKNYNFIKEINTKKGILINSIKIRHAFLWLFSHII